jgi:small subunit ribosomal protein S20
MPNIKSAIKRVRTSDDNRTHNQAIKSEMRSSVKRVVELVDENNADQAKVALTEAISNIDKAVQKGIIHKNNGDRKKSGLTKKVNSL